MRYVFTAGNYAQFYGYVFQMGKPTEVTDRHTLAQISKDERFRRVEDEKEETEAPAEVLETPVEADPEACPKCGKVVKQGRYMHIKFCRGR